MNTRCTGAIPNAPKHLQDSDSDASLIEQLGASVMAVRRLGTLCNSLGALDFAAITNFAAIS